MVKLKCSVRLANETKNLRSAENAEVWIDKMGSREKLIVKFTPQARIEFPIRETFVRVHKKFIKDGKLTIVFSGPPRSVMINANYHQLRLLLHEIASIVPGMEKDKLSDQSLKELKSQNLVRANEKIQKKIKIYTMEHYNQVRKNFPSTLETIVVSKIGLATINMQWFSCPQLTVLDLSGNAFNELSVLDWRVFCNIRKAENLVHLDLSMCKLKELPVRFVKSLPKKLKYLNLEANMLKYIPDDIVELRELTYFSVRNNRNLDSLPEDIFFFCTKLMNFSCAGTSIKYHPAMIRHFRFQYFASSSIGQLISQSVILKRKPPLSLISIAAAKIYDLRIKGPNGDSVPLYSLLPEMIHPLLRIGMLPGGSAQPRALPTKLAHSFACQQGALRTVRFNNDGNYCLTGGVDKSVALWNPFTATMLHLFSGCGGEVRAVASSGDNSMIAAGGTDKILTIFDVESGKVLKRFRGHGSWINTVYFDDNSSVAFSGGQEGLVYIWDLRDKKEIVQILDEANDAVLSLHVNGAEIATGSADHKMRLYDVRQGWLSVTDAGESVTHVHISDDKESLLMASMKSPVKIIDKSNGKILAEYKGHKNEEFKLECGILSSGDEIVTGSEDGFIYVFDFVSKKVLAKLDHSPAKYVHSLSMTDNKETKNVERPEGVPAHRTSEWAKDGDEEDRVEKMIKDSGCWDNHIAVVNCMSEKKDWRQCQEVLTSFRTCMMVDNLVSPFSNFEIDEPGTESSTEEETDDEIYDEKGSLKPFKDTRKGQTFLIEDWYMNPSDIATVVFGELDILKKQASYLTWKNRHSEAFEVYSKILLKFSHNDNHKKEVLDAMAYCALKSGMKKELELTYRALRKLVDTLGDQMNLWSTTVAIAENQSIQVVSDMEHLRAVIHLCALAECGRHWLSFDNISTELIPKKAKLRLGAKVRAFFLLKAELRNFEKNASSTEKLSESQMIKIKKELQEEFTEEEIIQARDAVCTKLIKKDNRNPGKESNVDEEPPPHASKLGGKMKTPAELQELRKECILMYAWMFEGLENIKKELYKEANGDIDDVSVDELVQRLYRKDADEVTAKEE